MQHAENIAHEDEPFEGFGRRVTKPTMPQMGRAPERDCKEVKHLNATYPNNSIGTIIERSNRNTSRK
jgi:hypothetical protein